jgi:hypothetical protein
VTDFSALDRADDFVYAVGRWIGNRAAAVGLGAWNTAPEHAPQRARAARLMDRAALRVGAEVRRLEERGGTDHRDSIAHLHKRNQARDLASRAAR